MISKATKEYRENFVKEFLNSIENPKTLDWKEPWKGTGMPENAVTGKRYRGINLVYLNHMANVSNKQDNRWATFNQIKDKGWFLACK